jgi:hypothetical protein
MEVITLSAYQSRIRRSARSLQRGDNSIWMRQAIDRSRASLSHTTTVSV